MGVIVYSVNVSGSGEVISQAMVRETDGVASRRVTVPAGKAGTLSTWTDANTGVWTGASGHGILDTDRVDVFWSGGRRYDMDVTAVTSTTVSIDVGAGDNLPIATTAMVICKRVQVNADIDGDVLSMLSIVAKYDDLTEVSKASADFQDSGSASIEQVNLTANQVRSWDITAGDANVFTGNPITKLYISNGSSANAVTFVLIWGADATP